MGLYADFIAASTVIDKTDPQHGPPRTAYNELLKHQARLDQPVPTAFGEIDEIQVINAFTATVSGGNFTITIVDELGTSHTTANILWNAAAATIETAIDVKMTADSYTGWTNGDIAVTLTGNLSANAATLTYSGNSVDAKNMGQATVANVDLSGGGTVNGSSTTTHGQTKRLAWAVMWAHGLIAAPPVQGQLLSPAALQTTREATSAHWPNAALRKALAWQAAIDDNLPALRAQLETLFRVE
jgi:hypothetical protein